MGCFSFMCKECGKPILSNSFRGQQTKLFLLKEGEVVQEMEGEYDSYGRVFTEDREDAIHWNDPMPEKTNGNSEYWKERGMPERDAWSKVCDLMFDKDESNGIAAVHSKCFCGVIPTTRSEQDPMQGWGDDGELFGNVDSDLELD